MSALVELLQKKSFEIRQMVLEMCIRAGTGHLTSSLSCTDLLVVLYYSGLLHYRSTEPEWPERDRFILSKGQASPVLYAILADCGFFDVQELDGFAQVGGRFGVHLQHDVPGVECTSGSLGHGFGLATGMALAARMDQHKHLVYALLGDGECYEGTIWEAAMFAAHNQLNNLVAIIDRNGMCVTDFTEKVVALEPMADRWAAFGWDVRRIDGHSHAAISDALTDVRSRTSTQPLVIIADTVKGEGIESISNKPLWHAVAPRGDEATRAREELQRRYQHE